MKAVLDEDGSHPPPKRFGNPWKGPKDGKHYRHEVEAKDMRK